ncbi:uncharacterized protein LOC100573040 [Acyrthosiphon pisum]|uniref:Ubiquitin-like protease family profile domain-containing protein n=1 Tax=Acyrthosiphon pisum TaxID=7029 RepID=A0A8R2JS14_ACYPI|nr:uncharacterized protein LOC100573040 [Acyrthosiphon pisum]|eukprot:XP_008181928.1 PREDICTED: uncharacterized protein LOC100573040 [Acyrthosiphon pisum]
MESCQIMAEHTVYNLEPIEECEYEFEEVDNSDLFYTDEVINKYMDLITERSPDTVYAFNTYFYKALSANGYPYVCRWTKKIDIFSKKKLFIPIHIEDHWCLVCVCLPQKSIKYYDTMGGRNFKCLKTILKYLNFEYRDKKKKKFHPRGWLLVNVKDCPQQSYTWDCRVFVCVYAEHISRGASLDFSQEHIEKVRRQIPLEIKKKKLIKSEPSHLFYNEEVINEYMDLITESSPNTVYAFNTFFYQGLSENGYSDAGRWTRRIDIFSKKKLFIPIHIEGHWILVYVCFPQKSIKYCDTMGRRNLNCLNLILKYLKLEHHDKKGECFNTNGWSMSKKNCPQQLNTRDCGLFICMLIDYFLRGTPLDFSQQHMDKYRRQIALEIKKKKLKKSVPSHLFYNDEVINKFMDVITERSPDTVYAFNTFFYKALSANGYSHVSRWTKKIDIFSKQKLFIPIHIKNHWCLVYVCFPQKSIKYYDSKGGCNMNCLKLIMDYLMFEHIDKKEEVFNPKGWLLMNVKNCPQQLNTWDCGVFVCLFAEHLSKSIPLHFSQDHIGTFRRRIELEIKKEKLKKSVPET